MTAPAPGRSSAVVRLNTWISARMAWVLVVLVVLNLAWPAVGRSLRDLHFFQVPTTDWSYDFPTLALTLMMLAASCQCRMSDLGELFRRPRVGLASLCFVFVLGPLAALLTGALVGITFPGETGFQLGFGLFFVALMPVAMTASVYVRLAAGNVGLVLALIAVSTTLCVGSVPSFLHLFPGLGESLGHVPVGDMVKQLVLSVTLPLVAGASLRGFAPRVADRAQPALSLLGHLGLFGALSTNVAGAAGHLSHDWAVVTAAAFATVALNVLLFGSAIVSARVLRAFPPGMSHSDAVALILGGGMRSTGTAMVVGAVAFPLMPLVTIPAAVYSISQQLLGVALLRFLQPHGMLLRRSVGQGRADLESFIGRIHRQRTRPVTLLYFRFDHNGLVDVVPFASRVLPDVRCKLRGYDFVSLVEPNQFAVVLPDVDEQNGRRVAERIRATLCCSRAPAPVRVALVSSQGACRPGELVDAARRNLHFPARVLRFQKERPRIRA